MKITRILGTCLIAVWGGFISVAAAEDSSVMVDLSVLDRLSPAPQAVSAPQPLFPVVKKSAAKKTVRKKPVKKAAAKKPAKVKVVVKETVTEKLVIPAQSPQEVLAAPAVEKNAAAPVADQVAPGLPTAQPIAPVVAVDNLPVTQPAAEPAKEAPTPGLNVSEPVAPAPQSLPVVVEEEIVEVVEVEPVSAPKDLRAAPEEAGVKVMEDGSTRLPVANSTDVSADVSKEVSTEVSADVPTDLSTDVAAEPSAVPSAELEAAPVNPSSSETGLLIEDEPAPALPAAKTSHRLLFEPDVSELSAEQQRQVDEIIASFKDAANNKIAIIAYNQDNGVDSFRKKRICLDRVVKIRSYLLQKGYKDFAVKVINVDSSSDRANVVEIEEM